MATNECVYGKVTETNLVHRISENLGKQYLNGKNMNAKKELQNTYNINGRK